MPNYLIQRSTSVAAEWNDHAAAIFSDLSANPATTAEAVAARLAVDVNTIKRVLSAMDRAGGLWRGYDCAGQEFLWTIAGAQMLVFSKMPDAREWLTTHDGAAASELAVDLAVHEAIAIKLAQTMAAEGDVKLTPV